jgi:hypothetical protein
MVDLVQALIQVKTPLTMAFRTKGVPKLILKLLFTGPQRTSAFARSPSKDERRETWNALG